VLFPWWLQPEVVSSGSAPAPTVSSATIANATPNQIAIVFSAALSAATPATSAFTITDSGGTDTVSSVSVAGSTVTLTKSRSSVNTDVVTVSYTQPGLNPLAAAVGGTLVASFSNQAVTNNVTPLLQNLSAAAGAAYSVRLLSNTYAGMCMNVRRGSDNTTSDIGFVNGVLDTATLLTFCGAGNGFVHTWYDQSGNGRDMAQVNAANIVTSGVLQVLSGSLPAPAFQAAVQSCLANQSPYLYSAGSATMNAVISISPAMGGKSLIGEFSNSINATQYAAYQLNFGTGNGEAMFIRNDANTVVLNNTASLGAPTPPFDGTPHQVAWTDSGTVITGYVDGVVGATPQTYARSGSLTPTNTSIGGVNRATVTGSVNGAIAEVLLWASVIGSADLAILYANQKAFYSTP